MEKSRALLRDRKLQKYLWEDAMRLVVYVENRVIHKGVREKTPYQLLYGRKPNVSNLRIFGCRAYPFIFDQRQRKLDDKTYEGIFLGYDESSAAYRVYIPTQRKIMKSIYVIFNEEDVHELVNPHDAEERNNHFSDYDRYSTVVITIFYYPSLTIGVS